MSGKMKAVKAFRPPSTPSVRPVLKPPLPGSGVQRAVTPPGAKPLSPPKPLPTTRPPPPPVTREQRINQAAIQAGQKRPGNTRTNQQRQANIQRARNKAASRANNPNPNPSGSKPMPGPPGSGSGASGYGSPGAMGSSSYPSGTSGMATGSTNELLGRIATALEQIVQRGGKRSFTLRKRKTRGRGNTRRRR
jgi:hypothetical protein